MVVFHLDKLNSETVEVIAYKTCRASLRPNQNRSEVIRRKLETDNLRRSMQKKKKRLRPLVSKKIMCFGKYSENLKENTQHEERKGVVQNEIGGKLHGHSILISKKTISAPQA